MIAAGTCCISLQQIIDAGGGNGKRDQEFDPGRRKLYNAQRTERQGYRMTNSERGNQYYYLFPVLPLITQAKGCYEQNMVHSIRCKDMFYPQLKIKCKILHVTDMMSK